MSLEAALAQNTAALDRVAAAFMVLAEAVVASTGKAPIAFTPAAVAPAPVKSETAVAPAAPAAPAPTPAAPPLTPPTLDEIKKLVTVKVGAVGREAVAGVLNRYGARKAGDLDPSVYGSVYGDLTALAA